MYVALSNLITAPDFGRVPTDVDCPHKSLNYVTFDALAPVRSNYGMLRVLKLGSFIRF